MIGVAKNQNVRMFDEDVADVAEVHGQRRQNQREPERQDQLHEHDDREPQRARSA